MCNYHHHLLLRVSLRVLSLTSIGGRSPTIKLLSARDEEDPRNENEFKLIRIVNLSKMITIALHHTINGQEAEMDRAENEAQFIVFSLEN